MLGNFGKTLWSRQRRARLLTCSQCAREVHVRAKSLRTIWKLSPLLWVLIPVPGNIAYIQGYFSGFTNVHCMHVIMPCSVYGVYLAIWSSQSQQHVMSCHVNREWVEEFCHTSSWSMDKQLTDQTSKYSSFWILLAVLAGPDDCFKKTKIWVRKEE